jgi:hypothetical protein
VFVESLSVSNFRSFVESGPIKLSRINVLIGPNTAGKSSLLRALYAIQGGVDPPVADVRLGSSESMVEMRLSGIRGVRAWGEAGDCGTAQMRFGVTPSGDRSFAAVRLALTTADETVNVNVLPSREPDHVFVPYFSRRSTT